MAPSLEAYANEKKNNTNLIRIDVDQNRELSRQFGVKSIPFFVIYDEQRAETSRGPAARKWVNETILPKN